MFLLTLPNSELAGVDLDRDGTTLVLRFAAAFGHRDDGVAGYLRPVALRFRDACWQGDEPASCIGGLAHGSLQAGGRSLGPTAHQVPVPAEAAGEVVAELRLISGTTLRIVARQVEARVDADAVFHESFAC